MPGEADTLEGAGESANDAECDVRPWPLGKGAAIGLGFRFARINGAIEAVEAALEQDRRNMSADSEVRCQRPFNWRRNSRSDRRHH
jgi:hypothetical protein